MPDPFAALRWLGRVLAAACCPPRPACRVCRTHAIINAELAARLIAALDRPPAGRVLGLAGTDRATPPLGLPRLPLGTVPGWASLYEADDPDGVGVDV